MAQSPTSSSSTSSTSSSSSTSSGSASTSKFSSAAQSIIDRLQQSQSVFVSKNELSEDDEDALEAAGYALDADVVRDGYFIHTAPPTPDATA